MEINDNERSLLAENEQLKELNTRLRKWNMALLTHLWGQQDATELFLTSLGR